MDGSGGDTSSDDERSLLGLAPGTSIARASPWLESARSVLLALEEWMDGRNSAGMDGIARWNGDPVLGGAPDTKKHARPNQTKQNHEMLFEGE